MNPQESHGPSVGFWSHVIGRDRKPNRWKGFVLGAITSQVALIAMTFYQVEVRASGGGRELSAEPERAGRRARGGLRGREQRGKNQDHRGEHGPLDSISIAGRHYKDGETSTAALGRIAYHLLTGKEPSAAETQSLFHKSYPEPPDGGVST